VSTIPDIITVKESEMLALTVTNTEPIERELASDPNLAENSRRGYLSDLKSFERWRGTRTLTKQTVELFAVELKSRELSPSSINRKLSAVRWWVRRLVNAAYEGNLPKDQLDHIQTHAQRVLDVRGVKGNHAKAGRHISDNQVKQMLENADVRDAALISLAWQTGLRKQEIVNLRKEDLTFGEDCIELRVLGKGDKVRVAYLYGFALQYMLKWLQKRGDGEGPVFCRSIWGGGVTGESLSPEGMAFILRKYITDATWHDFRRTCISNLLDKGVDLVTVQSIAGHSSPKQTASYDRRGDRAKRAAVKLMELDNAY
jgi:site-specific recombinase XerD